MFCVRDRSGLRINLYLNTYCRSIESLTLNGKQAGLALYLQKLLWHWQECTVYLSMGTVNFLFLWLLSNLVYNYGHVKGVKCNWVYEIRMWNPYSYIFTEAGILLHSTVHYTVVGWEGLASVSNLCFSLLSLPPEIPSGGAEQGWIGKRSIFSPTS